MMPVSHSQLLPMGGLLLNPMPESSRTPTKVQQSSRRLFIGDIPKNIKADAVKATLTRFFPTAAKVEVYSEMAHGNRNRGFAFLEFESPEMAAETRKHIIADPPNINGRRISCDWAQLEPEVSEDIMKQVKVLFVRNVHHDVTEERLHNFFGGVAAGVEKVKRQKMHAFVHFSSRKQASIKKDELNGQELNGLTLEIAWSKPKPRAHPYLPAVPNTHYILPGLLTPLIDAPPVPLIRQPDLVAPTVVSQELLTSKSSIMNYFQILHDFCRKTMVSFPVFLTELYYVPDNTGRLSTNYRIVTVFENGVRIEGELRPDLPTCMESTIICTVTFMKTVRDLIQSQQVVITNKPIHQQAWA